MLFLGNGDSVFQGNYYRLFGNFVLIIIILRFLVWSNPQMGFWIFLCISEFFCVIKFDWVLEDGLFIQGQDHLWARRKLRRGVDHFSVHRKNYTMTSITMNSFRRKSAVLLPSRFVTQSNWPILPYQYALNLTKSYLLFPTTACSYSFLIKPVS